MLGFQLKASMIFHEPSTPEMLSAAAAARPRQENYAELTLFSSQRFRV